MPTKETKFQIKVWNYLTKISMGKVRTYLQVAKALGKPKSAMAIENAIAKNQNQPKIPCHRVIRSDGKKGGYSAAGGIVGKIKLLRKEKIVLNQLLKYIN